MKEKARELMIQRFGKEAKDMDLEEILMAISVCGAELSKKTGKQKYKDLEDVALQMLTDSANGLNDKATVKNAEKILKKKGYKIP